MTLDADAVHRTAPSSELVSLAERMGSLHLIRVGLSVVVLTTAFTASGLVPIHDVLAVTLVFIGLSTGLEIVRRVTGSRGLALITLVLLLDAVYLSWVAYVSGGAASPLRVLLYVHLVAVTLIASYRTGLKLAAWYSLLYLATSYAEAGRLLPVHELVGDWLPGRGNGFALVAPIMASAPWLVTLAAAALSALNERELRRRSLDLEHLAEMAGELDRSGDEDDPAEVVAARVARWLGDRRVLVLRRSGELGVLAASVPAISPDRDAIAGRDEVVARAWSERRSQLVRTLGPDADPFLAGLLPDARNVVVSPMSAEGDIVGALVVEYGAGRDRIRRWTVAVLERFASHAALAIRNAALLEEIRWMASTDGLTGIANRRTFEETLGREIARAERTGEPVTLVMLDVDHFKRLNDEHGHQVGDAVLRAVGAGLSENLRPFDTAARYGGEEFALILPGCAVQDGAVAAERIRRRATASTVPQVTLSAGAATFPNDARDASELVRVADAALYGSKRSGRDRLTIADRRQPVPGSTPR